MAKGLAKMFHEPYLNFRQKSIHQNSKKYFTCTQVKKNTLWYECLIKIGSLSSSNLIHITRDIDVKMKHT